MHKVTRHKGDLPEVTDCVGVIGLGNVGFYYVRNLMNANCTPVVFDRDRQKIDELKSLGALSAVSIANIAARCDCILLALPNPPTVLKVLYGKEGILSNAKKGMLIIDASTIDPGTAERIYADAGKEGVKYLEAPMSGGEPGGAGQSGAEAGTVTFMVGGDKESFRRALPILNILGSHALYLGHAGMGSKVKLISNLIAGLNMLVLAEGFVLGAANGISHETLLDVFRHTDAKSYAMLEEFAGRICSNNYEGGFAVDLMHKDHRLAGELGRKSGVPLLLNQLAQEVYQIARAQGLGRSSHAVVVELMASMAGVELFNKGRKKDEG